MAKKKSNGSQGMTIEEIAEKMDALDSWELASPCHWALKPRGSAFPYFCCFVLEEKSPAKVRVLWLDGWQTFHDYIRSSVDHDFGFYSQPLEMSHFELVIMQDGRKALLRDESGYAPREANERERELCAKLAWETYGVMLRLESDSQLPLMFADEQAVFARVEGADGTWHDDPIEIPPARPLVEEVTLSKKMVTAAKDFPMRQDYVLELDMRLIPRRITNEPRPRLLYLLSGIDAKTGEVVFCDTLVPEPEGGLRGMWQSMAPRVLAHFVDRHVVPNEVRTASGRVFRMMRPLCLQLPFKLAKVSALKHHIDFK